MKFPFDSLHLDVPVSLATYTVGAAISAAGVVATTVAGWYIKLAAIDPQELAIQPLHVVLISFIIALAVFIVLILRAVWGKGLETVNRFSDVMSTQNAKLGELIDLQTKRVEKLESLSFDTLKEATSRVTVTPRE